MSGLLERLNGRRPEMTGLERRIADHLETGYPFAGLETATAIGAQLDVSPATVVRFISKLGYSGYLELQKELREQVASRLMSPLQRLEAPRPLEKAGPFLDLGDVVARTFETAMADMTRTYGSLDRHALEAIANRCLASTGRIYIISEKKGRSIGLYLFANLNLCLPGVILLTSDASFDGDKLLDIGPDDTVIVIDVRRYVRKTILVANWAVRRGAGLIVLFTRTVLRLAAATGGAGAFDSYLSLMLLCDVLTNLVSAMAGPSLRARLQLGEEAWQQLQVFSVTSDNGFDLP
jgi:DNA-binding MurR/RpiR family transcriptional regulator